MSTDNLQREIERLTKELANEKLRADVAENVINEIHKCAFPYILRVNSEKDGLTKIYVSVVLGNISRIINSWRRSVREKDKREVVNKNV